MLLCGVSRGESLSLPFSASRDHPYSWLVVPSSIFKVSISDHSSLVTSPSDYSQEGFSAFKDLCELSLHLKTLNLHHIMFILAHYYADLDGTSLRSCYSGYCRTPVSIIFLRFIRVVRVSSFFFLLLSSILLHEYIIVVCPFFC